MKRVTVKDLAKVLNVSLNTINKSLYNKPGVSEETRKRVLQTAKQLGYQVNRVAQSLARNPISIGVIMPEAWPEYHNGLKEGINRELEGLRDYNIISKYYPVPGVHSIEETVEAIKKCAYENMNAVIMCPPQEFNNTECLKELYERNIPLITLGSDIEEKSERLCCVRVNAHASGRLAAEYMQWMVDGDHTAAVIIGNKDFKDHKEKVEGFLEGAKQYAINIEGVFETQDDPELAYYLIGKLVKERTQLGGIYAATGNSLSVCRYLVEKKIEHISIIGTDIHDSIRKYVKSGIIKAIVFQDTAKQGEYAVRVLYDYLVKKEPVAGDVYVTPQLILPSLVDFY